MRRAVRIIARPESAPAFLLAGLQPLAADSAEAAAALIRAEADRGDAGVLLVEDGLYQRIPAEDRRALARRPLPMVVPYPGPAGIERRGDESYIVELLREMIGYRVRLR